MRSDIEKKSFLFSVRIIKMSRYLQEEKKEYILTKQLIRSGTSIGANVVESQQAQTLLSLSRRKAGLILYPNSALR